MTHDCPCNNFGKRVPLRIRPCSAGVDAKVNQWTSEEELLLRIAYLVTKHCILRHQIKVRLHLNDGERMALAEWGCRTTALTRVKGSEVCGDFPHELVEGRYTGCHRVVHELVIHRPVEMDEQIPETGHVSHVRGELP